MRDAACTRGSGLRDGIELGSQGGEGGRGEALPCGTSLIASPIAAPTEPKMGCGWSRGVPDMGLSPQGGTGCPAEPCCLVGTGRTELQGSGGGAQTGAGLWGSLLSSRAQGSVVRPRASREGDKGASVEDLASLCLLQPSAATLLGCK